MQHLTDLTDERRARREARRDAFVNPITVTSAQTIYQAFEHRNFYYRFLASLERPRSRIMDCDSVGEKEFIEQAIRDGAIVQIVFYGEARGPALKLARLPRRSKSSAKTRARQRGHTLLSGERIAPAKLQLVLTRGPFHYQLLDPPSKIEYCDSMHMISEIAAAAAKRPLVVRSRC